VDTGDGGGTHHVLAVDDEPALLDLVAAVLSAAGHRVRTAGDGRQALAALAAETPDVVLLDVLMPELDGWEVLEAIGADPTLADLPVVMMTALSGERDVIRGHLTGAVEYVVKPFDIVTIVSAIARATVATTEARRAERRDRIRTFVSRLAEIDAGRASSGPRVRFAGLEAPRLPTPPRPLTGLGALTPRQRTIAALFGEGRSARDIAGRLGTSRSNVYATRARIARHLGIDADEVPDAARDLGLTATPGEVAEDG
jgi:CheY-like chemotaxis protein/DNA-binding CsgD family transcriptional regulator